MEAGGIREGGCMCVLHSVVGKVALEALGNG